MEIQIKFFLKQIINNDENYAHDTTKKVLGVKGTNIFFFKFRVARICFCRLCGLFNIFPKVMMLSGFVLVFFFVFIGCFFVYNSIRKGEIKKS